MFTCTVKYGVDVEPVSSESVITIGSLRRNSNLRRVLGWGDNVNMMVNSVAMPDDAVVPNGAEVQVETAANKKASLFTTLINDLRRVVRCVATA